MIRLLLLYVRTLTMVNTNDIPIILYRIQDSVCPRECLDQSVHLQVLINPQRIQRRRVESGQEHIHNDQDINLTVLYPLRQVFIVVLEFCC